MARISAEMAAFESAAGLKVPRAGELGDFNVFPEQVWPRNTRRQEDGEITIAGVSLVSIAHKYGTPCFVFDEDDFRSRCQDMARAFGGAHNVHYASKAMSARSIARIVDEEGLSLDVASEGELRIALAADFPAARITAHGNNKSASYLRACLTAGVGHVVIDASSELELLDALAMQADVVQKVLIRVKPGIEAHTHELIATAHEDQKFGFSLASGAAFEAALAADRAENLELDGLHSHVGSQVFDAQGFAMAAERLVGLLARIKEATGRELPVLDLGGGYGIAYTEDEKPLDIDRIAATLLNKVAEHCAAADIALPQVMVEPGRALIGPSMVTLYEVGVLKDVHVTDDAVRRYVAVDGGMSDNIRPSLYQAEYDLRVVNRDVEGQPIATRVVGSHCESGDVLIKNMFLPDDVSSGDLVAIAATGAYCYAMASRYNMMLRPPVIAVRNGQARVMIRRETIEDVLALEN